MEKSIVNRDMELGESGGSNETPLEELRKQAIDHYEELANKCHHFNSFVKDAILSYTPPSAPPPDTVEPTAKEGEMWQTINPNLPKYAMSTNLHTEGMPVNWIDFWCEVENWYGDHRKRETAEQLLIRLQKKFKLNQK